MSCFNSFNQLIGLREALETKENRKARVLYCIFSALA